MSPREEDDTTVLVTGVAGYIGSHFALACQDAGWRVVGVDDLSVGDRSAVPPGVVFRQVDCGDPVLSEIARREGAVAAVHFAGLISVEESMERPRAYYDVNLVRAKRFFASVAAAGIRHVVFSSTAAVYGEAGAEPVTEDAPLSPASPYGRSKLAAERILRRLAARRGLDTVILRYFNVAGADPLMRAGPRPGATHLIKIVSEAATGQRKGVVINGEDYATSDGTAVRDYIHVSDLADVHVAAIRHLQRGGGSAVLNCGYGNGRSVRQVIEAARRHAPVAFDTIVGGRRPGDVGSIVANTRALRERFDWTPRFDELETILQTAIQWELRQVGQDSAGSSEA
jgi:UDP-glucose 4-epimerase